MGDTSSWGRPFAPQSCSSCRGHGAVPAPPPGSLSPPPQGAHTGPREQTRPGPGCPLPGVGPAPLRAFRRWLRACSCPKRPLGRRGGSVPGAPAHYQRPRWESRFVPHPAAAIDAAGRAPPVISSCPAKVTGTLCHHCPVPPVTQGCRHSPRGAQHPQRTGRMGTQGPVGTPRDLRCHPTSPSLPQNPAPLPHALQEPLTPGPALLRRHPSPGAAARPTAIGHRCVVGRWLRGRAGRGIDK